MSTTKAWMAYAAIAVAATAAMMGAPKAHAGANVIVQIGAGTPVYDYGRSYYYTPVPVGQSYYYNSYNQGQRRGRDLDRDGIPDRYDRDLDNDGRPNHRDWDRDGDGVPNRYDRRPDNRYRY